MESRGKNQEAMLDTTMFLATALTSYTKMISLWVLSLLQHFLGFRRTEKKCFKVIDDDPIYNRIVEFKAKNEIITMNRNYSNVNKKIWRLKYVHEHDTYDRKNDECLNLENFHKKPGAIVSCENVRTNNYVQMYEVLLENNLFLPQKENPSKKNHPKFLIVLGDFLYKVGFV